MALVTITVQGTPLYLDENNVLMVYSVGSTVKIDYYDAKSLNVKTVKVSESIATIKAATTSLIELTDLNSSDAFLINKDIISLVEANGSGSKVVLDYKGRDKLISVTENKAAIDLLITPVEYPLVYKALLSQNAPIATTTDPTMVAGQIWTLEIYSALDPIDPFNGLELISGTIRVAGSKYRSNTNTSFTFTTTEMSYDGSPYIVSTDVNGDFAPFINTLGEDLIFEYDSTGNYLIKSSGIFVNNKTIVRPIQTTASGVASKSIIVNIVDNDNDIAIYSTNDGSTAADGELYFTSIEIEVYP